MSQSGLLPGSRQSSTSVNIAHHKGGRTSPDIVICDFKMPRMKGVEFVRIIRRMRAASAPCTIFVRTTNPEEDGDVAAAGATGYRVSNTPTELTRAVTSAIEAHAWLSEKV